MRSAHSQTGFRLRLRGQTVFDADGLDRAPYRLILPACECAVQAAAGSARAVGLAAALLPRGTAGIVANVVRVNDNAAAPLMPTLHRRLRGPGSLPGQQGARGALSLRRCATPGGI